MQQRQELHKLGCLARYNNTNKRQRQKCVADVVSHKQLIPPSSLDTPCQFATHVVPFHTTLVMACPHLESTTLSLPSPSQSVYREDCTQCFDSIVSSSLFCLYAAHTQLTELASRMSPRASMSACNASTVVAPASGHTHISITSPAAIPWLSTFAAPASMSSRTSPQPR